MTTMKATLRSELRTAASAVCSSRQDSGMRDWTPRADASPRESLEEVEAVLLRLRRFLDKEGCGLIGLIAIGGVGGVCAGPARRCRGRGRGLPRMEVLTPNIWKTSTCLTLPSLPLT